MNTDERGYFDALTERVLGASVLPGAQPITLRRRRYDGCPVWVAVHAHTRALPSNQPDPGTRCVILLQNDREIKGKTRGFILEMALTQQAKTELIGKYKRHKSDSGSSEVQIAILSQRILQLQEHFKAHASDHHSRRGLLSMVARRRRLLNYLKAAEPERYKTLIQSLGIRR